jgi:hypothetical protein
MSNPKYASQANARQDYVSLATDPRKANSFLSHLSLSEATVVNCAVTAIVPTRIYNNISSLLDLRDAIPAYALAARMCIDKV